MTLLEEYEIADQELDSGEIGYCHILCECHPVLALCGAYKPVRCGLLVVSFMEGRCPECQKTFCPDCNDFIYECPRCGEQ
jgi:hypothetical protein